MLRRDKQLKQALSNLGIDLYPKDKQGLCYLCSQKSSYWMTYYGKVLCLRCAISILLSIIIKAYAETT